MASKANKKKKATKSKVLPLDVEIQDQVKETVQTTPGIIEKQPTSQQERSLLPDVGLQQLTQRPGHGGEYQDDTEATVSAQKQCTSNPSSAKKSKKRQKKKSSAVKPLSGEVPPESGKEEKTFTFEEQVEWCIRQLELGLHHCGATKAQKDSNQKNIRTLRSLKVPVPRKRQLMRNVFGDYRSKMMTTPLPEARAKEPCVNAVERKVTEDCGKFFKYKHPRAPLVNGATKREPFQFDFEISS